jgi:hypothetical protein
MPHNKQTVAIEDAAVARCDCGSILYAKRYILQLLDCFVYLFLSIYHYTKYDFGK